MIRRPPRFTRTDTLFPYTTRFRSGGPGALVVGDIDVTGGISSEFSLTVSASGQVAGATHDVTVGNISVALDMSRSVDASISNSGYNTVGELTLGDVGVAVGDGANARPDFPASNSD